MRALLRVCAVSMGMWAGAVLVVQAAEASKPPSERELRAAAIKAEKRFFDLYNRVNDDQRHDVYCQDEEVAGSRLRKGRTCRTEGESAIGEEAAREYLSGLDLSGAVDTETVGGRQQAGMDRDVGGPVAQVTAPKPQGAEYADKAFNDVSTRIREERAAFDRHLTELMDKNPELRQRLEELLEARRQYETARKR